MGNRIIIFREPMKFILRDRDGFATEEQKQQMYVRLPIAIAQNPDGDYAELVTKANWEDWVGEIETKPKWAWWTMVTFKDL